MMPATPITSKQEVRIADLVAAAAREATTSALEKVPLESEVAQKNIIMKGGELQALIRQDMETSITRAINKLSGRKHPVADELEQYFSQVFGFDLDLTGVSFPEKEGMSCYMAVPTELDEDQIMSRLTTYFKVKSYSWMTPVAKNIDRKVEQKRPPGLYVLAHVGGDEPDAKHLNKSYDDAIKEGLTFLNAREYPLVTCFHMWKHKKWMDKEGWTRTSSLWSDGGLVGGRWHPGRRKLYLDGADRAHRDSDAGVRELFLG